MIPFFVNAQISVCKEQISAYGKRMPQQEPVFREKKTRKKRSRYASNFLLVYQSGR